MKNRLLKSITAAALSAVMALSLAACGKGGEGVELNTGELQEVDPAELAFPLSSSI